MKLGDILLAALRKDPEGAGRIVARAAVQAAVPVAAATTRQTKVELPRE
jgi:hypothetical protein